MKALRKNWLWAAALIIGTLSSVSPLSAQVSTLNLSLSNTQVSFQLQAQGVAAGSAPVSVTLSGSNVSTVRLYAYFSDPNAALLGTYANIPPSNVMAQVSGGTGWTRFSSGNTPTGNGAGVLIYSGSTVPITETVSFQIDLTTLPQLPAGTYSGTLLIQAESF